MSERFIEIVKKCNTARRNMEVKNLRQAKAKCPYCDGHWFMILAGPKKHMHMKCDGNCGSMLMT